MGGRSGFAGLLVVDLLFPGSQSLKDKRAPLRSIIARLKAAGFSASEVAHHDLRQRAQVAISIVARGSNDAEHLLDEAVRICERPDVDVSVIQRSVLSLEALN
jgi:uncharacterized protein YlxP (DUF503 family)